MIIQLKKISSSTKFLLGMIVLYLIVGVFNPGHILLVTVHLWKSIVEIIPILIFVFLFIFFVNLLVNPEKIKKHLGKDSGWKGWVYASLGSIFITGPPYVLFPILSELKKHGMKDSLMAVFMNNRNVQLPYLPVMIYYFGLPFTVVISVYILIFAILNGMIVGRLMENC